jgi:hypothetical protein
MVHHTEISGRFPYGDDEEYESGILATRTTAPTTPNTSQKETKEQYGHHPEDDPENINNTSSNNNHGEAKKYETVTKDATRTRKRRTKTTSQKGTREQY